VKKIVTALLIGSLMAASPALSFAAAKPCKDAKGKFIKCAPAPAPTPLAKPAVAAGTPAAATTKCRDAKGKFTKCPTAGAAPKKQCRDAKGKFVKC
jgi:hypothetical protein